MTLNPLLLLMLAPALGLLAVLQATLGMQLAIYQAKPHFVLLLVLVWTMLRGRREGMVLGFIGGFWLDLMSLGPMGLSSCALVAASFAAAADRQRLRRAHQLLPVWLGAVGGSIYLLVFHALLALSETNWVWLRELRSVWMFFLLYQIGLILLTTPLWRLPWLRPDSEAIHVG